MSALKPPLPASDSERLLVSSDILRQAGWLAVAKIIQGAANIGATLAVARHLGPTSFGLLSLATAIAVFVGTTASLGLEHIAIRELSTTDPSRHAPMLPVLQRTRGIGALLGCFVLLVIAATPAAQGFGVSSLLLILCLLPLAQIGDLAEWRLVAKGRSRSVAIATILSSPAAAFVRLAFALGDAETAAFAWLLVGEWALRSLLLTTLAHERAEAVQETESYSLIKARALLRDSAPLLMAGIAVFIYMRIDQFMLAAMLGPREVGLYSAIVQLAEVPLVLPVLFLRAALPTLTQQAKINMKLHDQTLTLLMRCAFFLHLGVAAVMALFADFLIVSLFGNAYQPAVSAFRVQVAGAPFVALGVLSSSWFVINRRTSHTLLRTLAGAAINAGMNMILIPTMGILGAAFSTLTAFFTAALLSDLFSDVSRPLFWLKIRAIIGIRVDAI